MKSGICVWVSHANVYFSKPIYEEHPSIQQYKWLISFSSSGAAGQINESQTIDKWENFTQTWGNGMFTVSCTLEKSLLRNIYN